MGVLGTGTWEKTCVTSGKAAVSRQFYTVCRTVPGNVLPPPLCSTRPDVIPSRYLIRWSEADGSVGKQIFKGEEAELHRAVREELSTRERSYDPSQIRSAIDIKLFRISALLRRWRGAAVLISRRRSGATTRCRNDGSHRSRPIC